MKSKILLITVILAILISPIFSADPHPLHRVTGYDADSLHVRDGMSIDGDLDLDGTFTGDGLFVTDSLEATMSLENWGLTRLGNATTDYIYVVGYLRSALLPKTDDSLAIGSASLGWDFYAKDILVDDSATVTGVTTLNGKVYLGDGTADDITFTGYVASDFLPKTTGAYDLGSSGQSFGNIFFDSTMTLGAGALITNPHSDTIKVNEANAYFTGKVHTYSDVVIRSNNYLEWGTGHVSIDDNGDTLQMRFSVNNNVSMTIRPDTVRADYFDGSLLGLADSATLAITADSAVISADAYDAQDVDTTGTKIAAALADRANAGYDSFDSLTIGNPTTVVNAFWSYGRSWGITPHNVDTVPVNGIDNNTMVWAFQTVSIANPLWAVLGTDTVFIHCHVDDTIPMSTSKYFLHIEK